MSSKKIWQYPEATSITNDDYILMDSNTETGSQCLKANKIGAVHITKTVTERKVYKASDDNANGFSEVTVAVPYTDVHYDKDDIVSFVGEDLPLKSVTAYIEPQQDLHGYDSPWVGGAGKNKIDVASGSTTTTITLMQKELNAGTYTYSAYGKRNDGEHWRVVIASQGDEIIAAGNDTSGTTLTRSQVTFTLTETTTIRLKLQFLLSYDTLNYERVQLESGSTATSFAPYSNECPISGWSAVDVNVSGKNIFDKDTVTFTEGFITSTGEVSTTIPSYEHTSYIKVNPNTNYVFSGDIIGANLVNAVAFYNSKKEFISRFAPPANTPASFTTPNNCTYIVANVYNIKNVDTIQLEEGLIATEYESFGTTITIQLGDTYYGGKLDVVSGVLTVDRAYVDLGSLSYTYEDTETPKRFRAGLNPPPKLSSELVCSCFKGVVKSVAALNDGECCISGTAAYPWLRLRDDAITDATAFKTAVNGQQLVYELATPTTIQLSPTQVNSLLGVNNVWADTGEIAVEWQTLYVTPTT